MPQVLLDDINDVAHPRLVSRGGRGRRHGGTHHKQGEHRLGAGRHSVGFMFI